MINPFDRSAIDGTDDAVIPLKVVGQLYLRALPVNRSGTLARNRRRQ